MAEAKTTSRKAMVVLEETPPEARVVWRVVEVAVEKAASLQSSLPQKQVEASFKVSSPMSKETPGSTPETHPDVWELAAPQLQPPALTPSMVAATFAQLLAGQSFVSRLGGQGIPWMPHIP